MELESFAEEKEKNHKSISVGFVGSKANMDPFDEKRLRDEVIYLHSLWHQGPPPNPIPIPSSHRTFFPQPHFEEPPWRRRRHQPPPPPPRTVYPPAPAHTRSLPPAPSTAFKKSKKKKSKRKDPGPEWPCPDSPDPKWKTGWGSSKPHSDPPAVSPQEKERFAALQAQNKACKALKDFLCGSEDDEEEDDDDGDGDDEMEEFFVGVFMEDDGLRRYYQRCFEGGEFCCLVCGAVGKKNSGKKFKDCVALVQHSMSVLRGVRRRAHRAFGQAVCKVLGWDIDRLPTIVMKGEPLGYSAQAEGEPEEDVAADDGKDGSHKSDDEDMSSEHGDEPDEEHAPGFDQNISGCSSKEGDILDIELENGGGGGINEGEPKEKIDDDDNDGIHKSDDKVGSFGHGDEPDEEHASEVNQSISELQDGHRFTLSHLLRCSPSAEEQASVEVLKMQHKALEACQEYLVGNDGSECDDDIDQEDEDELIDDYGPEECEEFKFFLRLFTEDSGLRKYYENNHTEGDFYCLVCGGIRKKMWKRFKDCIALLQHSATIKKTKRKKAHRAYSHVICKVLGWDIDRLPAIVLKGESLGSSLAVSKGKPEKPEDCRVDDSNVDPEKPADSDI